MLGWTSFARLRPWVALLSLLLAGCQTTDIAPISSSQMALEEDEQRLWARAGEEETAIERSGLLIRSPELEAYLDDILARLHPGAIPGGRFRAHVLLDPTLNAFAFPDGTIYIHTGLLSRMENEAQLATVLSHELTHTTHRHGVKGFRSLKNKTAFLATFVVGTSGVGGLIGVFGTMAAVSGYSQDLEREADQVGFQQLIAAGYDPRESAKVFQILQTEAKRAKIKEPYFFGSHPKLQERIDNFTSFVQALPPEKRQGRTDAAALATALHPLFARNAIAAFEAGDPDAARASAERFLASAPDDPAMRFLVAETHRKQGDAASAATALEQLDALAQSHPDFADTHRARGMLLLKGGRKSEAALAFRRYLELKPDAADRAYVQNFLSQCEPKS